MQDYRMETFLTVCKFMNYTLAAKELNITQPAVSQHIRFLEDFYHTKLFDYEGKRIRLTKSGEYLRNAAITLKHNESFIREELLQKETHILNFGATRTIGDYIMPAYIAEYHTQYADAKINMYVDNTEQLLKKIDDGQIDFAFIEGPFSKINYEYLEFKEESYIAVSSTREKIEFDSCRMNSLYQYPLIIRETGSGTREILERHLASLNSSIHDFKQIIEVGSIYAIKQLVQKSVGITFLYEAAVIDEMNQGVLQKINIDDFQANHPFTMVWRKHSMNQKKYMEIFHKFIKRK